MDMIEWRSTDLEGRQVHKWLQNMKHLLKWKNVKSTEGIFVSYCYYNKLPQILWLKTSEMYSLVGLETRSTKWVSLSQNQCWQNRAPSGVSRGEFFSSPFPAFRAACIPWLWAISSSLKHIIPVPVSVTT